MVGDQVTYTLAVTNLGPSVSVADITVVDTLPSGLSIASIDDGAWECHADQWRDRQAHLRPGQGPGPERAGRPDQGHGRRSREPRGHRTSTLRRSRRPRRTRFPENNTATVEDPVISEVQLGISKKTTGANPVSRGSSTEFTITVTNAGPAKAKNVQVVDQLEAGLRATSASGPGWTCDLGSGTVVTCTRANFPVSASPSDIVIKADVDKAVPGGTTLKNTATVTTTSPQEGGNPPPAISTVDVIAEVRPRDHQDPQRRSVDDRQAGHLARPGHQQRTVGQPGPDQGGGHPARGQRVRLRDRRRMDMLGGRPRLTCELAGGLQVGQSAAFSVLVDVVNGAAPR